MYEIIQKDNKVGVADETGKIIIPCDYEEIKIGNRYADIICAKINGCWGLMNDKGAVIKDFEYEDAYIAESCDGYFFFKTADGPRFKKDGKWGTLNMEGEIVEPFIHDDKKWDYEDDH